VPSSVQRHFQNLSLQPHRCNGFNWLEIFRAGHNNDPFFIEIAARCDRPLFKPTDKTLLIRVGEKSNFKHWSTRHTQPLLLMRLGYVTGVTHYYKLSWYDDTICGTQLTQWHRASHL
jgi:hypothetical protein